MKNNPEKQTIKVAHIITRMIIGGAQENTLSTVIGLQNNKRFSVSLITGPEIGPEGRLNLESVTDLIFEKNLVRNMNPFLDFLCLINLIKVLRIKKFDIVHTHSSKAGIIGRLAALFAKTPVIIHTIHGLPFHKYQNSILNIFYIFLEKICSLFTDKIIVVTDTMMENALNAGIGKKLQYKTIFSGMDLDSFLTAYKYREETRKMLGISEDKIVLGKIARLFNLKGHEFLIAICKQLTTKYPNLIFLWVGDGILKDKYISQINEIGILNKFIFTGLIEPCLIKNYLSAMDILVHVSLREGLARVIPQAFAASVPVVSFNVDGAKDIIEDGKCGYLVKPGDLDELLLKIENLILDNYLRKQFIENALKKIDPYFRNEFMVEQIINVYSEFIC